MQNAISINFHSLHSDRPHVHSHKITYSLCRYDLRCRGKNGAGQFGTTVANHPGPLPFSIFDDFRGRFNFKFNIDAASFSKI